MKERLDIVKPARGREKYDFEKLRPGASWHVATKEERVRIMAAFTYWAKNIRKIQARATSLKVDGTDPDGPGYRIWFLSDKKPPQPAAAPTPVAISGQQEDI